METKQENVIATDYADVMQKSYIDYAMSAVSYTHLDVYKRQVDADALAFEDFQ